VCLWFRKKIQKVPRRLTRFREPLLILLSAVLLGAPFHFAAWWPAAFIAFVPYFLVIEGRSSGDALKASFLFGCLFWMLTGFWLMHVTVPGFFLIVAYLALYFAVFGLVCADFLNPRSELGITLYRNNLKTLLFIPASWVVLEWLRGTLVFGGMPWSLVAYSQWRNLPFIQIADLTGAYGVSFFVLFVNVALFKITQSLRPHPPGAMPERVDYRKRSLAGLAVVLVLGFIFVGGYGAARLTLAPKADAAASSKRLRISVLQGNIPQDQKWDARIKGIIFEKYKRLTFMSAIEKSDLIVWPETSFPGYLEDEPVMAAHLRSMVRQSRTEVLVGAPTYGDLEEGVKFFNSAVHYGADGEEKQRYNKVHLVPFGEYIPFEPIFGVIRHFIQIGNFTPGREKTVFTVDTRYQKPNSQVKFSTLVCFEDIFPGLVRSFVKNGAELLINVTNDAWFGKTSAPYQHAAASVFRAVENRVPVVRATNTGYSCFISPEGQVLAHVEDKDETIFVTGRKAHDVIVRKPGSLYARFGDWFVFLCFFLCFLAYRDRNKQQAYARF
jgi:apolipoprotein N-acyltransferase